MAPRKRSNKRLKSPVLPVFAKNHRVTSYLNGKIRVVENLHSSTNKYSFHHHLHKSRLDKYPAWIKLNYQYFHIRIHSLYHSGTRRHNWGVVRDKQAFWVLPKFFKKATQVVAKLHLTVERPVNRGNPETNTPPDHRGLQCSYCMRYGHLRSKCRKKKHFKDQEKAQRKGKQKQKVAPTYLVPGIRQKPFNITKWNSLTRFKHKMTEMQEKLKSLDGYQWKNVFAPPRNHFRSTSTLEDHLRDAGDPLDHLYSDVSDSDTEQ